METKLFGWPGKEPAIVDSISIHWQVINKNLDQYSHSALSGGGRDIWLSASLVWPLTGRGLSTCKCNHYTKAWDLPRKGTTAFSILELYSTYLTFASPHAWYNLPSGWPWNSWAKQKSYVSKYMYEYCTVGRDKGKRDLALDGTELYWLILLNY